MLACSAMKKHLSKKSTEPKLTCDCPKTEVNQSLVAGLGCALAASILWAILATSRPDWLVALKMKLQQAIEKFKSKSDETCSPETGTCSNLPPSSENAPVSQEPPARISLKAPRPRARVCPYRRSEAQLRKKIKQETFEDLRQLIRLTKMEVQIEVANDMKAEADAEDKAKIETDVSTKTEVHFKVPNDMTAEADAKSQN